MLSKEFMALHVQCTTKSEDTLYLNNVCESHNKNVNCGYSKKHWFN